LGYGEALEYAEAGHLAHTSRSHHHAKGTTVTIADTKRFELHQYLRTHMETNMADTLMDHLPPAGWSDLARTSDVSASQLLLKNDIEAVRTELKSDIQAVRTELKGDIAELRAEMVDRFAAQTKWFLGFMLTNIASMTALVIAVILKA
jgi:hypothetical protein